MTGTERAAMRLALGLLRDGTFGDIVTDILWHGGHHALVDAFDAAGDDDDEVPRRILRARLALYLRAVLRADAGDMGLWWHARRLGRSDSAVEAWTTEMAMAQLVRGPRWANRLARPLWYDAPRSKP